MADTLLKVDNINVYYGNIHAVKDVSFEVHEGEIVTLIGANGAGKSTLMKCMFGIYKMDEGEIEYEGEKVNIPTPLDALNRGIAMVHQELQPIPARTVAENIWLGRYPTKKYGPITVVDHPKMYKETEELLKKLKLDINPHAKLGSLSIAQMQMVEIAKAVSANCKVLILDEPTRGIDVGAKYEIYCIIAELAKQGKSIIMISSEMSEIIGMSNRVMVMCDGRITGFIDGKDATQENIMALATQFETAPTAAANQ